MFSQEAQGFLRDSRRRSSVSRWALRDRDPSPTSALEAALSHQGDFLVSSGHTGGLSSRQATGSGVPSAHTPTSLGLACATLLYSPRSQQG